LQRYVFNRASASVSISEAAAEILRVRGYAGPSTAMGFGTDVEPLPTAERATMRTRLGLGDPLVGYVGRLVPEKGVDIFIEALARLPDVFGVIAGGGPERQRLEDLAAERGITSRLSFTGVLAAADAARIIGALDVLALPSRTRPNWAEQFGRVLIEAMASDVAVVATDSGAIGEVVGEAGILVREDDADALAVGISQALEPDRNRQLRAAGLLRVRERFTNEAVARALYGAMYQAANEGKASLI
jgi:glycosyltransferase involved in cell wall biosynthesis